MSRSKKGWELVHSNRKPTAELLLVEHDPKNSEKRDKAAARGGRAKAQKATKELHLLLEDFTQRVIDGELETSRGVVANQLISTRIRLLGYERRLKELVELEECLQPLEEVTEDRRAGGRRG